MSDGADDATEEEADATEATKREGHLASERTGRRKDVEAYLQRGTLVGRYVVLEKLGEGGMGVVYSAYDPELDRKVAIKLLQARSGGSQSGGDQAWLLREAQALARLAHPNVVGVHDVGSVGGDRVFVAMELVDGVTLRKWLKAPNMERSGRTPASGIGRAWREVLPIMVAAGNGLAAAHAAGLVHRDFKPDNVLVGNDGRVRVMDFGLARLRPGDESTPASRSSDLNIETRSPLTDSLTMVGSVVGTPAYMAPEIYDGESADASTDQFAFGVTLFEALFGVRPFSKEDLVPPRATPPKPKLPVDTKVPARIQRAVLRAIAIDPAQRFGGMDALLAELAIDPNAGKRRILIAAGVVAVGAAGLGGALLLTRSGPTPCLGIEERLVGVWDAAIRHKVRDGFVATKRPFAAEAFARLDGALTKYATEWTATSIESCKATRVRRDQNEEVLSLRQTCLDQRLEELRALAQVISDPHEGIVDKGEKLAWELEPLAGCSNVEMLRAPGEPPPELRAKVEALRKPLAEAKAQLIAGKHLPALVASQKVLDAAKAIAYEPFQAEALLIHGAAYGQTGNSQEAANFYTQAAWAALRAKRDDIVAIAALSGSMMVSDGLGKPGEAKIWLGMAEVFMKRSGLERVHAHRIHTAAGVIAAQSGDHILAVAEHQKAFDTAVRMYGADSPALWNDELLLATTLTKALSYQRAVKHFEHAIALREKVVGADHMDIALMLSNLGIGYRHLGENKKARAAFDRTIAMREKLFGKKSPILVAPLVNYADFLNAIGDSVGALPMIERAKVMAAQVPGVEHPSYHETATTYAEVIGKLGRVAEARKAFDEVMAIEQRVHSATLPITQTARAELELAQKAWPDAAAYAEKAIAGFEAASGAENPELWRPLTRLAQAKLGQGDAAAAKPLVERAIAIGEKAGMGEYELRSARETLAAIK